MFGPIGIPELVMIPLALFSTVFWIWMLVDCAVKGPADTKAMWIVVIAIAPFFGALAYFFMGRRRRS